MKTNNTDSSKGGKKLLEAGMEVEVVTRYERGKKPKVIMVAGRPVDEYEYYRRLSAVGERTKKP